MVEFAVIIIFFSLLRMLYSRNASFFSASERLFYPIIIGILPCLLIALFIGKHITLKLQKLYENIFSGVILMFLFFLTAIP